MSVNIYDKENDTLIRIAGGTLYSGMPVGTISPFGGSVIPSGYLLCNGAEILKTAYAELYAVIGDAFGTASDNTKFKLPDLREATTKGAGLSGKSSAHYDADGVALGEFVEDRNKGHYHNVYVRDTGHSHTVDATSATSWGQTVSNTMCALNVTPATMVPTTRTGSDKAAVEINGSSAFSSLKQNQTAESGSATAEVKAVGVNYIIKAKQVAAPADFIDAIDESKPIEVSATLDFNEYGNALVTPPTGYKVISAIMPDYNWAFDVFYTNGLPYVHSRGMNDYSAKITGTANLQLVYIKI